ncbi:MAG: amidohydrolase family protein, partial [Propionicimonas sp.]|nr:amidohydrolase family protein [Propionicimonas sp.]
ASLLGALESMKSGVTFINDMATAGERYDVVAQAVADSGIRAHVGSAFLDRREGNSPVPGRRTDQVLDAMQRFHACWDGAADGRIRAAITPVGLPSCSETLMRGSAELARDLDAPLHTHCAEEHLVTEESHTRFGVSEVQALERLGLLGERTTLAHAIWVDDADIAVIAGHRALVSHCPSTNMKITDGIAPIEAMRRAGVKLALGSDGAASSGSYDILQETRLAAMLAKVSTMDSQALPNAALWSMLIAVEDHFGVHPTRSPWPLQPGMTADLALVRYPQLHLVDDRRFLSNLVFSATAGDVRDVVIDGRIVVRDGALTEHDEARLLARVREAMASLVTLPTTSQEVPS